MYNPFKPKEAKQQDTTLSAIFTEGQRIRYAGGVFMVARFDMSFEQGQLMQTVYFDNQGALRTVTFDRQDLRCLMRENAPAPVQEAPMQPTPEEHSAHQAMAEHVLDEDDFGADPEHADIAD